MASTLTLVCVQKSPSDKSNHITLETSFQAIFTKDKPPTSGERGTSMRKRIMIMLYTVASMIDDIAYFVIGKGETIDCEIKTLWGEHYYG